MMEEQSLVLKCELTSSFWDAVRKQVDQILDQGGDIECDESMGLHRRQFVFQGDRSSIGQMEKFLRKKTYN